MRNLSLFMIVTLSGLFVDSADAQFRNSLWSRRSRQRVSLFYDTQARAPGDLLTIVVSENTNITNRDQRALRKDSRSGARVGFEASTGADFGTSSALADLDHSAGTDRGFSGDTRFSSQRGFNDRITVRVQAVLSQGNLWVAGCRRISIEGDDKFLRISGIVRPVDINPNNTVHSRYIANLRLKFVGTGAESKFTNQGWFNRKMNRLWPF